MAVKIGFMPDKGYTKMDNAVCRIRGLSDASVRLYMLIAGTMNGRNITDGDLCTALDWSMSKLTRSKNELRKLDLIHVHQAGKNFYYMFIGSTKYRASAIFRRIGTNFAGEPITMEEMQKRVDELMEECI